MAIKDDIAKGFIEAGGALKSLLPMDFQSRMNRARDMGFDTDTVYYHGTTSGDIDAFDLEHSGKNQPMARGSGVWLTPDPDLAKTYAGGSGGAIYPVVVRKGDMAEVDFRGSNWSDLPEDSDFIVNTGTTREDAELMDELGVDYADIKGVRGAMSPSELGVWDTNSAALEAQDRWHDSLLMQNVADAGVAENYQETIGILSEKYPEITKLDPSSEAFFDVVNEIPVEEWDAARAEAARRSLLPRDNLVVFEPKNIRSVNAAFDPSKKDSANLLASKGAGIAPIAGGGLAALAGVQSEDAEAGALGSGLKLISSKAGGKIEYLEDADGVLYKRNNIRGTTEDITGTPAELNFRKDQADLEKYGSEEAVQKARDEAFAQRLAEREANRKAEELKAVGDYRMDHSAPYRDEEGYHPSLDDVSSQYGDDIYTPMANRYYGGTPAQNEAIEIIQSARGKPNAEVTIYRAVPSDVDDINPKDWVSLTRQYAEDHGESALKGDYKIIEQKAKASDLFNEGYVDEWGFDPASKAIIDGYATPQSMGALAGMSGLGVAADQMIRNPIRSQSELLNSEGTATGIAYPATSPALASMATFSRDYLQDTPLGILTDPTVALEKLAYTDMERTGLKGMLSDALQGTLQLTDETYNDLMKLLND